MAPMDNMRHFARAAFAHPAKRHTCAWPVHRLGLSDGLAEVPVVAANRQRRAGDGTVLLGAYNDEILTTPGYKGSWIDPLRSRPDVAKLFPVYTPYKCTPPCEVAREAAYKDAAIQWIQGHISIMPHLLK